MRPLGDLSDVVRSLCERLSFISEIEHHSFLLFLGDRLRRVRGDSHRVVSPRLRPRVRSSPSEREKPGREQEIVIWRFKAESNSSFIEPKLFGETNDAPRTRLLHRASHDGAASAILLASIFILFDPSFLDLVDLSIAQLGFRRDVDRADQLVRFFDVHDDRDGSNARGDRARPGARRGDDRRRIATEDASLFAFQSIDERRDRAR